MKSLFLQTLCAAFLAVSVGAVPANLLTKAPVLPLALDDTIQFRKFEIFVNDPKQTKNTQDDFLDLERSRVNFGAVSQYDRIQRYGQYYHFFWRTLRPVADLTVRFEYRQEKLGSYVQARERTYHNVKKGVTESSFTVVGDDYNLDGRVTSWRALVIENGRIVALTQSALWR